MTEVQVSYTTAAEPKKPVNVKLVGALADFNQSGFDVKNAINGKLDRNDKAWAVRGTGASTALGSLPVGEAAEL